MSVCACSFEDCVDRWVMRIELDNEGYVCPKFAGLVIMGYQEVVSVFVKSLVYIGRNA